MIEAVKSDQGEIYLLAPPTNRDLREYRQEYEFAEAIKSASAGLKFKSAFPIFAGFIAGYLAYDYTHYHVHHHTPKTRLGKRLREQHMRHHFQDHRYGFGVSTPLWDAVFRTLPRRRRH